MSQAKRGEEREERRGEGGEEQQTERGGPVMSGSWAGAGAAGAERLFGLEARQDEAARRRPVPPSPARPSAPGSQRGRRREAPCRQRASHPLELDGTSPSTWRRPEPAAQPGETLQARWERIRCWTRGKQPELMAPEKT
ncbi:unnamed protein product [Pleuronectes platessa]|uniref:Uncharacterized protein n=1 Tax=Pleuronectes platessa TaxID=8262 RepID=A0A9N7YCH2_PLEPL|nr:unnamed protein product [Pleuronectes platessa]